MSARLPLMAWLVIVWLALWGDLSVANVVSGLVVSGALVLFFPIAGPQLMGPIRPLQALVFLGYFLYKLFEASVVVAWEVITPRNEDINLAIVAIPVTGASPAVTTIVANAVSLVPGTLTLEVREEPMTLYVHVLHLRTVEDVRRDVLRLEWLALRAFGSEEALSLATNPADTTRSPSVVADERMDGPAGGEPKDGRVEEGET
ncbi:MAG TPA: Na+/H+ antiporter subunit E [Egibacteraceae bacterium]|nr:Na+/H+ antiporter subunit E [Egibacteraceae bacterium]